MPLRRNGNSRPDARMMVIPRKTVVSVSTAAKSTESSCMNTTSADLSPAQNQKSHQSRSRVSKSLLIGPTPRPAVHGVEHHRLILPAERGPAPLPCRLPHPPPPVRVARQQAHGAGEVADRLLGMVSLDLDPGLLSDLRARPAQVEADDRPPHRHRLHAGEASGVVQARMDQDVRLCQSAQSLFPRQAAPKLDPRRASQRLREVLQSLPLGAVPPDPIFSAGQVALRKGAESEVTPFP